MTYSDTVLSKGIAVAFLFSKKCIKSNTAAKISKNREKTRKKEKTKENTTVYVCKFSCKERTQNLLYVTELALK